MKKALFPIIIIALCLASFANAQIQSIAPMSEGPSFNRFETPVSKYKIESVTFTGYGWGTYTFPDLNIEPGQTRTIDLTTIHGPASQLTYKTSAKTHNLGTSPENKVFLVLASVSNWPTAAEMNDFAQVCVSSGMYNPSNSYHSSKGDPSVYNLEPQQAPVNWRSYLPFISVMTTESNWRTMKPVSKAAIMSWVSQGGSLVLYEAENENIEEVLRGRVRRVKQSPVKEKRIYPEWRKRSEMYWPVRNQNTPSEMQYQRNFPFAVEVPSGRLGGMILATLFFIIAGPVNYAILRRKKNIRKLMVTLPLLSVAFSVLMIIFFFVAVGFSRKGGTVSFTFFDQDRALGYTYARSSLISGIYPLNGFTFHADTQLSPPLNERNQNRYRHGYYDPYDNEKYEVEITPGQWRLKSGLFKPSVRFDYFTMRTFASKERLRVDSEMQSVINGFETPIRRVIITNGKDAWSADDIKKEGGSSKLEKLSIVSPIGDKALIEEALQKSGMMKDTSNYISRKFPLLNTGIGQNAGWKYIIIFDDAPSTVETGFDDPFSNSENILFGVASSLEN